MPDTRRTLSALQTLLADNTAGDISAQDARDELISSHPEKVSQSAAYASEPASAQITGDLFLPTDAPYLERWNGSAWKPFGPAWPLTKPVLGDYTAVNSAAAVQTNGHVYQSHASNGGADNVRAYVKTAPATPWTFTALLSGMGTFTTATDYFNFGVCFRQSSDGKLVIFGVWINSAGDSQLVVANMDSPSSQSSRPLSLTTCPFLSGTAPFWLRVADNGTNRLCQLSADGFNWLTAHSVARTTFLTADQLGFFVNPYNVAGGAAFYSLAVG